VGGHGAEVDDAHVPDRLDRLTFFDDFFHGVRGHGTSWHWAIRASVALGERGTFSLVER
jgi:hypothetical protein